MARGVNFEIDQDRQIGNAVVFFNTHFSLDTKSQYSYIVITF